MSTYNLGVQSMGTLQISLILCAINVRFFPSVIKVTISKSVALVGEGRFARFEVVSAEACLARVRYPDLRQFVHN